MTTPFPGTMDLGGFNAPSRIECDIFDLVVEGAIPPEIDGTWYRLTPDPQFPPRFADDSFISGDGMISMFRFRDGHVDFRSRYVLTERLRNERKVRRALFGRYRSPYTDDSSIAGTDRGVANTTPIWHGGRLFALKEDSLPVEVDPHSLRTIGPWNFSGRLRSRTMTAHPHVDGATGELYFFGYEAGGLATRDVAYCTADRNGELVREQWFEVPYCALMHDFAVTREHVVFPVFPTTADIDRLRAGGPHWVWEPEREVFVGIMPRDGGPQHLRWFRRPACMSFHIMNAFTDGHLVHVDLALSNVNVFPFIQRDSGMILAPADIQGSLARWTFDLSRPGQTFDEQVLGPAGDLPRVADRDHMVDYAIGYYMRFDPEHGPPRVAGPVGAGFNTLSRLELGNGRRREFFLPDVTLEEPVHIPSRSADNEGYLAIVAGLHEEMLSEVLLLEAARPDAGPIARIKMPFRLRPQIHGNWVPAAAFHAGH